MKRLLFLLILFSVPFATLLPGRSICATISPSSQTDCTAGSGSPRYVLVGRCETPGFANAVDVSGTIAYIADEPGGLIVIDVSTPQDPFVIAQCSSPYWARDVALSPFGNYAYVADMWNGVWVVDISEPYNPRAVAQCNTPGEARALEVCSSLVYVADFQGGLRIIDATDPHFPFEVGHCNTPGRAYNVCVSDTFAYVADGPSGLRIINVADPSGPHEVGFCDTPGNAQAVEYWRTPDGAFILVADGSAGLRTIDVTIPQAPHDTASCDLPGEVVGIENMWGFAYASCGPSGVQAVSFWFPWDPHPYGYYDTPGFARDIWFNSPIDLFYIADRDCGLQILDDITLGVVESHRDRSGFALSIPKNPIRDDHADLRLALPQPHDVVLDLYDATGRRAQTYSLGHLSAGEHFLRLRIADLSSGIYFLRLGNGLNHQSVKLVRIK